MAPELLGKQLNVGNSITKMILNTDRIGVPNQTAEVLQQRIALTDQYWAMCLSLHHQLDLHREELKEAPYFVDDLFADFEIKYCEAKAELSSRLAQKIGDLRTSLQLPPDATLGPLLAAVKDLSLPKITLPKFSGEQTEWDSFKERFISLVKNRTSLSAIDKLQHLLACLEGDAARRLRNLEVIGSNFEIAWAALLRRYDNKGLKLAVQLNKLLSMQPATCRSVAEINRLMDTTDEAIRALQLLKHPVDQWDEWLVHLIVYNLDPDTREDWRKSLEGDLNFPTYQQLVTFLEGRVKFLDTAHCNNSAMAHHSSEAPAPISTRPQCFVCNAKHLLTYCPAFPNIPYERKVKAVREHRLCLNCLRSGHSVDNCPSSHRCRSCGEDHHSILHPPGSFGRSTPVAPVHVSSDSAERVTHATNIGSNVLLGTAAITIESKSGGSITVRALIDPASEGSFVSEEVVQALSLARQPSAVDISGVGGEVSAKSSYITSIIVKSHVEPNFCLGFSAAVLPRLTTLLPRREVGAASWEHLQGLPLADPEYNKPAQIDCIVGAEAYPSLILPGLRQGAAGSAVAQNTRLGWILIGPTVSERTPLETPAQRISCTSMVSVSTELRRFWEIKELPPRVHRSGAEEECEAHFTRTHRRDNNGRYVVSLPFCRTPSLTNTRSIALQRFLSLERRLARDLELRESYTAFVEEYDKLHHLQEIPAKALAACDSYYLPHHAVISADKRKKLRVVFNASQSTSSSFSLNDCLHTGEALQMNSCTVITRWRTFQYVFTADIVKMFRQILIDPADATWQRILWRRSPEEEIRDFWLLTVTYGTACAPFLALRVLRQLATDEEQQFPVGSRILLQNMYADDACAGAHTLEDAVDARDQLVGILATAGMALNKWAANHLSLLPKPSVTPSPECLIGDRDSISILGLRWSPNTDTFSYKVQPAPAVPAVTKRAILTEVTRLYDPLGWLTPATMLAKLLLQELWTSGHDWDAVVGEDTQVSWK